MWWTNPLCNSAEDLGTLAENEPPTGCEPNEYHITEAYVDYTQESFVEQRHPNDFDYDDVARHSWMLAEDEPITLKKKASRPVCRRLSVMIERGDPLFAPHLTLKFRVSKKLKDTALKVNRLGFFLNDKESRFSLTVKQKTRIPGR